MPRRDGFTLIELSIVLVIIGLIVGGILVGQDLIKAAEIRASVSQLEKYKTSVNTFLLKYGALPGDMTPTRASRFGFFSCSLGGVAGAMDENGQIQPYATNWSGEQIIFWRHLTEAQMIDGVYGMQGTANINSATCFYQGSMAAQEIPSAMPPLKLGRGNYITPTSASGRNFFWIYGWNTYSFMLNPTGAYAITPIEAAEIDKKMDDGFPLSGKMIGGGAGVTCVSAASLYEVGATYGDVPECSLSAYF